MTNTANTFTTRELTKRGFTRRADLDFRDDGNAFKCFEYQGLIMSYLKDRSDVREDQYYLSIDVDLNKYDLNYYDVENDSWMNLRDEFNGVTANEIDVDRLIEDFNLINKGLREAQERCAANSPDPRALQDYLNTEIESAKRALTFFKANYNWFDSEDLRWDLQTAKWLEEAIRDAERVNFFKMSKCQLRAVQTRIDRYHTATSSLDTTKIYEITKKHMIG